MSIKRKSPIDKKFLEQIQSNLQHDYFANNLTQCLCHKNDDDDMIYDFEESKGLIYCKGIFSMFQQGDYMSSKHIMTFRLQDIFE
jgi:hypothetical protein